VASLTVCVCRVLFKFVGGSWTWTNAKLGAMRVAANAMLALACCCRPATAFTGPAIGRQLATGKALLHVGTASLSLAAAAGSRASFGLRMAEDAPVADTFKRNKCDFRALKR
jgi:hypothetical protein